MRPSSLSWMALTMARRLFPAVLILAACGCTSSAQPSIPATRVDASSNFQSDSFDYFSFAVLVGCSVPVTRALIERVAREFPEVETVVASPPGLGADVFLEAGVGSEDVCREISRMTCGWYEGNQMYFLDAQGVLIGHFPVGEFGEGCNDVIEVARKPR